MNANVFSVKSPSYQIFMLALCLYSLGVLIAEAAIQLDPRTRDILEYTDYGVCALFLFDFAVSLVRAPDRRRYFFAWGWLDLLSSIPMVDVARWGRIGRVLRIVRVLRMLRATKLLTSLLMRRRSENAGLTAALAGLLLVVFCSITILHVEKAPESNIKTAEDAIWWSFTTITTVGYGDRFPVTTEGRMIAALLICTGVGMFGTISGLFAAWFLAPEEQQIESDLSALRRDMAQIESILRQMAIPPKENGMSGGTKGDQ